MIEEVEKLDKQEAWNRARDMCCDECGSARGCSSACQLLRNTARRYIEGKSVDLRKIQNMKIYD